MLSDIVRKVISEVDLQKVARSGMRKLGMEDYVDLNLADVLKLACLKFREMTPDPAYHAGSGQPPGTIGVLSGRDKKSTCSLGEEGGFVTFILRGHREYGLLSGGSVFVPPFESVEDMFETFKAALRSAFDESGMSEEFQQIELAFPVSERVTIDSARGIGTMDGFKIVTNIPQRLQR